MLTIDYVDFDDWLDKKYECLTEGVPVEWHEDIQSCCELAWNAAVKRCAQNTSNNRPSAPCDHEIAEQRYVCVECGGCRF